MMKYIGIAGVAACLLTLAGCSSTLDTKALANTTAAAAPQTSAQAQEQRQALMQKQAEYWLEHGQGHREWLKSSPASKAH